LLICWKSQDGNTPLHLAVLRCDYEAMTILLRSGGRRCINIVNKVTKPGLAWLGWAGLGWAGLE